MLAVEEDGWPGVVATSALYEGPIDLAAFRESLNEGLATRPKLASNLAIVGPVTKQRLVWRHRTTPLDLEVIDRRAEGVPEGDPDSWLPDVDLNSSPWFPDLSIEYPVKMRLSSFSDTCHVFTLWAHHAVGDGSYFAVFLLEASARYHEKVIGSEPDWAWMPSMHAVVTAAPSDAEEAGPLWRYLRDGLQKERDFPHKQASQIIGTRGVAAPILASSTIPDDDVIQALRHKARSLKGSVTDLALAASILAIAEWNERHGSPVELQRHNVAVNLRGRIPEASDASIQNQVTGFVVRANSPMWRDPATLVRTIAGERKAFLDDGEYLHMLTMTRAMDRILSKVPVSLRLRLLTGVATTLSLNVTNLGVVFPEIVDGTFTGNSALQQVGEMELRSSVMLGNPIPSCPNLLALATTHVGLNLELSGNRANITPEELTQVLDQIIVKLRDFADLT